MLPFLFAAEGHADALIHNLIESTKLSKDPQEILKEMEAERKQMEEQFTIKAGEAEKLKEQDVLSKYIFISINRKYTFPTNWYITAVFSIFSCKA